MPGYSTVTGANFSTPSMGTGTSLFRKLCSVGSGFTITGIDLGVYYGGEAGVPQTGIPAGVPEPPLQLVMGLSIGPSTFTPTAILLNPDDAHLVKYWAADQDNFDLVIPGSTSSQFLPTSSWLWRLRFQYRLTATSDVCFQVGNGASSTQTFAFNATARVSYA